MKPHNWNWMKSTPLDPTSPDIWLKALVQNTSDMPEAGQSASVIVLRSVLNEDAYVCNTSEPLADAEQGDWLPWHVERGRVGVAELGQPGVLLVHEVLAGAAEDEEFIATTLKARAWKDTGYDPEGFFRKWSDTQQQ